MFITTKPLILASTSPRRQAFLHQLGILFTVETGNIDESTDPGENPVDYVARMAHQKYSEISGRFPSSWVLAADTTVFLGSVILGKPTNENEAVEALRFLRNRSHYVATAFVLGCQEKKERYEQTVHSKVFFGSFSEDMLHAYINSGEPFDKAGSYGIQGKGSILVEKIEGSYTNVVGLPTCEVVAALIKYGIVTTKY